MQELRFGLGLRPEHFEDFRRRAREESLGVDFLEIISENFFHLVGETREILALLRERVPILPHGVCLSIGGADELDEEYLERLEALVRYLDPPWVSDHLCASSGFGTQYHDLLPLPYSEDSIRRVVRRIEQIQERLSCPLLLENPTSYVELPGGEMTEGEFLAQVVHRSGCGLLLDVNNVFVNARNDGRDPHHLIESLPEGTVLQYHLAGHTPRDGMLIDTHGAPTAPEILELYGQAIRRLGPGWTMIERDQDIPPLTELLQELDLVRSVAAEAMAAGRNEPGRQALTVTSVTRTGGAGSSSLESVQKDLHRMLRGEEQPEDLASHWEVLPERLRLYRNLVRRHVREMIEDLFPRFLESLGREGAAHFADSFHREVPLTRSVLRENGDQVPSHAAELSQSGRLPMEPWQLELVELEWAVQSALFASAEPVVPGPEGLALNPTLQSFQIEHDVEKLLLRANEAGRPDDVTGAVLPDPGIVFVWRHPSTAAAHICRADDGLLLVFKMLHEGNRMEDVVRAVGCDTALIQAQLDRSMSLGLVIAL